MKSLVRDEKGELTVKEVETSPIISPTNLPKGIPDLVEQKSMSIDFSTIMTGERLLEEMKKAGGKNLVTEQFAILLTPKVKKSVNELEHHKWDLAHSYIRNMMHKLEKSGQIIIEFDTSTGKKRYIYSIKE